VAELGALELGGGLTGRADDAGDADADGERTMQARDRSATPTWRPEPRGAVAGGVVGGAVGASVGGAVGVSVDAADLDVPNYVEDDDSAAVSVDATTPAELVGLLYALLPEDGAACASSALLDQFVAAADATLGVPVSDADFARCRDVLLARGMIRRGKGRGAPLARRSASLPGPLFSR
jgi:hypothetical protein